MFLSTWKITGSVMSYLSVYNSPRPFVLGLVFCSQLFRFHISVPGILSCSPDRYGKPFPLLSIVFFPVTWPLPTLNPTYVRIPKKVKLGSACEAECPLLLAGTRYHPDSPGRREPLLSFISLHRLTRGLAVACFLSCWFVSQDPAHHWPQHPRQWAWAV